MEGDKNESMNISKIAIIIALVVIVVWGVSGFIINCIWGVNERGSFGDMFGAINALFSGFAFTGLIVTLLYQKEELSLQRKEISQTREELANQRREFEEQNKTLKKQRFENTFFNMLSLQQEILGNIKYSKRESIYEGREKTRNSKEIIYEGRNAFKFIYLNLDTYFLSLGKEDTPYTEYYELSVFDHYFRHLYRIIKFTHSSQLISEFERYEYLCILRAMLSDYELVMLFYNCLNNVGVRKFKPLVEKYALLKNLRSNLLVEAAHYDLYEDGAYKYSPNN